MLPGSVILLHFHNKLEVVARSTSSSILVGSSMWNLPNAVVMRVSILKYTDTIWQEETW